MGSILNIVNREGNTETVSGAGNISLISSKVLLEGPTPKWKNIKGSWMISGRRTYFDKIIEQFSSEEFPLPVAKVGTQLRCFPPSKS